tara:strand:+ start:1280 stop:1474 length:195 start_codon:yes stop_codon:yes gene_type:complete
MRNNNMIQETKDTAANVITVLGTGSVVMGWHEVLTFTLLITGITFNVVRIYEIRRKRKLNEKDK